MPSFYSALVQQAHQLIALRRSELQLAIDFGDAIEQYRAAIRLDDARINLDRALDATAIDVKVAS